MSVSETSAPSNFIRQKIEEDIRVDKNDGAVVTRFPPEPNGYLHIGHAKSICLNFGLARDYKGRCHLRFDDTNPEKEETEYVDSIMNDVHWLGFDWGEHLYYASDYFDRLYELAILLIKKGKAYVDSLSAEEIRAHRGTLKEPGKNSPYRDRAPEESLDLFERMKNGEFEEGAHVLRAKIDMASPHITLRDPVLYRIRKMAHHRTGDKWNIYPMYDFAHGYSDAFETVTHSICTLEFENHRPLYDWLIASADLEHHPQQIEFARLNLAYTITSKRKLLELVQNNFVNGWDDPRMPTIAGIRRRGYTPESIRDFCERIGVAKADSLVDMAMLEHAVREDLNKRAPRVMAVLNPLKVVIENYPEGHSEELDAKNNPEDPEAGTRKLPFSRTLYIERDDFREEAPKKFFRMTPGREVRLKFAYYVKCERAIKDEKTGEIVEIRCTYDPATKGGWSKDGRKVKGTLHWVSAEHAVTAEVRLYDRLFTVPSPTSEKGKDYKEFLNPDSLEVIENVLVEPGLKNAEIGHRVQFERTGYFSVDPDSSSEKPVFNRITALRDSWAKLEQKSS